MGPEPRQALPATACTVCVENKDDGLNIMWRGGAREGRRGRERERKREGGDDWPLLGIMENLEEDPLRCCQAVSDEEWSPLTPHPPLLHHNQQLCFFEMYHGMNYKACISILYNVVSAVIITVG